LQPNPKESFSKQLYRGLPCGKMLSRTPLPPIAGWRNWYKRVLADNSAKTRNWDSLRIAQCLELSLAETPKNENLFIAACHFWSNGVNAFLFGHGLMSPTLADVYMITGLDISGAIYPWE
jgi:hypothetical protein